MPHHFAAQKILSARATVSFTSVLKQQAKLFIHLGFISDKPAVPTSPKFLFSASSLPALSR